ncbi:MAG: class I SAM-dependent methyltransferase [Gammaproteobacteria bacterium]|nr:class I SAM-dependent methyltransferase [Gammaproteobacteria bacterium]
MSIEIRQEIMRRTQGALFLNIAYIGIVNHLFTVLQKLGSATAAELASESDMDAAYVNRWCDSAYAFELLDEVEAGLFTLSELGGQFLPDIPGSLMPFAVNAVLGAHMAERAAELMPSGERPGERVLAERKTVLPWFGPMLEGMFGPFLESDIIPNVPAYQEVDARQGLAVDLGCGNGWYLRGLAKRLPNLRGIGLDGFDENIRQASELAEQAGIADRVSFKPGDINHFGITEQADLIAMNRALHHVWDQKENVFRIMKEHLKPDGVVIIWEPNWPEQRSLLREPGRRGMAFQNLSEHVQGNHFLRPDEIVGEFERVGMQAEVYLFGDDREAVVVGRNRV